MKYLRILEIPTRFTTKTVIDIFEGDKEALAQDRFYWWETHTAKARYFKIEEVDYDLL